ncbi:hypothetical protein BDZ45DRAFT_314483 [Acephala macrosclerotiorum]|nr:hypothetical protein BDZ45DRAFT_314483 [Acephala macrosclerotiorum]
MQASADAIAVYCFASLILIVYTADTVVQWRTPQERSGKYLLIQSSIIVAFFIAEVVLVILSQENPKEARQVMLHGLQGLSLLQSLIIEVRVPIWKSIIADDRNRPWFLRGCTSARSPSTWAFFGGDVFPGCIFKDVSLGPSLLFALLRWPLAVRPSSLFCKAFTTN